jgi:hypothetical protein
MTIKGLQVKVLAKNNKTAQIEIEGPEDGSKQKIEIPSIYLPGNVEVGKNLSLYLMDSNNANLQEKKLAKAILEEILNGK